MTHDRYLVARLATQIWNLDEQRLHVFNGTYREYIAARERRDEQARELKSQTKSVKQKRARPSGTSKNEAAKKAARLAELEVDIASHEATLEELALKLQKMNQSETFDKIQSISIEYSAVQNRLEELMLEWEKLAGEQNVGPINTS